MNKETTVELILVADGAEADVVGMDRSGRRAELPHKIVINPYFFTSTSVVNLGYVLVRVNEHEVHRCVIQLSGINGRLRLLTPAANSTPRFVAALTDDDELPTEDYPDEQQEEAEDAAYEE